MQHAILGSSHSFHVMKTYNISIIFVFIVSTLGEVILKIFDKTCEIGYILVCYEFINIKVIFFNQNLKYSTYILSIFS
jgi:hypothetical protein